MTELSLLARAQRYLRYRAERFRYDRERPLRKRQIAHAAERAGAYFRENDLRRAVLEIIPKSSSTGASGADYHLLHEYIVRRRPRRILECGSGVTTVVMAAAMAEAAAADASYTPHLFTMENIESYHEEVKRLVPVALATRVDFVYSPRVESRWHQRIWGFGYAELPPGDFDFVFVDGPTEYRDEAAKRAGLKGANLDLLFLLERQPDLRLDAVVDRRLVSLEAYQSVLPPGAVRFDPVLDVGVIAAVSGRALGMPRADARLQFGHARPLLQL